MITQDPILIWPDGAPDAIGDDDLDKPTLTPCLPEPGKASGSAIIICPGGGYGHLAPHESEPVAEWLTSLGITAFILKYRLAPRYGHPAPLMDGQRAIKVVRSRATEFSLGHDRIGMLGFSAGGHLTSCVGTLYDKGDHDAEDPIERWSSRPDALVLIYPVISLETDFGHAGSRRNLLSRYVVKDEEVAAKEEKEEDAYAPGDTLENMMDTLRELVVESGKEDVATEAPTTPSGEEKMPPESLIMSLTTYRHVTEETPPSFLIHTATDAGVPCENSIFFARALRHAGVPVELHIFEEGPHGFGLAPDNPILSCWPDMCGRWLKQRGFAL